MKRLLEIPVLVVLLAAQAASEEVPLVRLSGTAEQIGKTWGETNRKAIAHDLDGYLEKAKGEGISQETLVERSSDFVRIAGRIAPHWLAEAGAVAQAAGVDEDLYVSFIANVYRELFLHECTSYAVSRDRTEAGAILFHKNRDNVEKDQAAFVVNNTAAGVNKFIGTSDASVLAAMMMVNDKGLAGSADYPGGLRPQPAAPRYRGLMNTFVLRYIAERASDCDGALRIIRDFVDKGYYAGGRVNGTHWLFVDRTGAILEVSNNAGKVVSARHTKTVYFSRLQDSPAAETLRRADRPIDFLLFHDVSRDPSICLASSIAGMTVEIDPDRPGLFTCAWISLPAHSVAFPLLMSQTSTPAFLVNGEAYTLGAKVKDQRQLWKSVESAVHASKGLLKASLAAGAHDDPEEKADFVDRWAQGQANMIVEILHALP